MTRIHIQFGHASIAAIERICRLAGGKWDTALLRNVVNPRPCHRSSGPGEKPIVSRKISEFPGQTAIADLFFPETESEQSHPALIMVCDFSKFVLARFISSVNPTHCIDFLLSYWRPLFGYPNNLLCDNTTSSQGSSWQAVCRNFNIRIDISGTASILE